MKRALGILAAAGLVIAGISLAPIPSNADSPDITAGVTFNRDVAPIIYRNCAGCHRPGEVAPMSLLSYKEARPWARSIKEKVQNHDMPPWHADPRYEQFSNDRRLSQRDIDTIVAWVDQGARETIDRVASIVLGNRENPAGVAGSVDHQITATHRDGERLLDLDVEASPQTVGCDAVVRTGVGGNVGPLDLGHRLRHRGQAVENARPGAEGLLRLVGKVLGILLVDIANRDQIDVAKIRSVERGQAGQVPTTHAAAADNRDRSSGHRRFLGSQYPPS